jgi:hypothetical protein
MQSLIILGNLAETNCHALNHEFGKAGLPFGMRKTMGWKKLAAIRQIMDLKI